VKSRIPPIQSLGRLDSVLVELYFFIRLYIIKIPIRHKKIIARIYKVLFEALEKFIVGVRLYLICKTSYIPCGQQKVIGPKV
jgi:hypothetical protein